MYGKLYGLSPFRNPDMGNKHSSEPGQRGVDPTSRSFSWQPDPAFIGVQQLPNPNIKRYGSMNLVPNASPHDPHFHPHGLPPPFPHPHPYPPHPPGDSPTRQRSQSLSNGSVINGVDTVYPEKKSPTGHSAKDNNAEISPPWSPKSTSPTSPNRVGSRPGTNDSGYFTGIDSDAKMRSRLRGSRLSLNEAIFEQGQGPPPPMDQRPLPPYMGPPGPGMMGSGGMPPNGMGGHPFMGPFPPMGPMMGPMGPMMHPHHPMFMRPPLPQDFDSKKARKWRKKNKKKIEKWNSAHSKNENNFFGNPENPYASFTPLGAGNRAQSVDNFRDFGLIQSPMRPFYPPPAPPLNKRFSSQVDLSGAMPQWIPPMGHPYPPGPPSVGGPYAENSSRRDRSGGRGGKARSLAATDRTSVSSGKGSRRSREATHFEEERPSLEQNLLIAQVASGKMEQLSINTRDQQIYESLKGQRTLVEGGGRSRVIATVDVSVEAERETQEVSTTPTSDQSPPQEKKETLPLKISAEAKAVLERNAELLGFIEAEKQIKKKASEIQEKRQKKEQRVGGSSKSKSPASERRQTKEKEKKDAEQEQPKVVEAEEVPSFPDTAGEKEIVAIVNPTLVQRKKPKSKDFEPLEAWRAIDVEEALKERHIQRNFPSPPPITEEKISVRLVPIPPSRSETGGEPIYFEYDDKLPDFKKRLIETGSFDFPEKFHHSSPPVQRKEDLLTSSNTQSPQISAKHRHEPHRTPNSGEGRRKANMRSKGKETEGPTTSGENKGPEGKHRPDAEKGSLRKLKDSVSNVFHSHQRSRSIDPDQELSRNSTFSHQGQRRAQPLSYDYRYMSSGSLTPSNANARGGECSEIDFSWVQDLETKFRTLDDFGTTDLARFSGDPHHQQPPSLDASFRREFENNLQHGFGLPDQHQHQHEPSAMTSPSPVLPSSPFNQQTRFFGVGGMYAESGVPLGNGYQVSHDPRNTREDELNRLDSKVRLKAAMFEQEAAKIQTSNVESRQRPLTKQNGYPVQQFRSRSVPKINDDFVSTASEYRNPAQFPTEPLNNRNYADNTVDGRIERNQSYNNHNGNAVETNGGYRPQKSNGYDPTLNYPSDYPTLHSRSAQEPLMSSKNINNQQPFPTNNAQFSAPVGHYQNGGSRDLYSGRSPSERKIQRLELQRREGWVGSGVGDFHNGSVTPPNRAITPNNHHSTPSPTPINAGGYGKESRLAPYHGTTNGIARPTNDAEQLQRNRVYDATEFYRHNYQGQRESHQPGGWNENGPKGYSNNQDMGNYGSRGHEHQFIPQGKMNGFPSGIGGNIYASQPVLPNGPQQNGGYIGGRRGIPTQYKSSEWH